METRQAVEDTLDDGTEIRYYHSTSSLPSGGEVDALGSIFKAIGELGGNAA